MLDWDDANGANTNTAKELQEDIMASKKSIYRDMQNNSNSRIKKWNNK